jgi:hypothetical protein
MPRERGQQGKRFEVGLAALALAGLARKRPCEQSREAPGSIAARRKDAEVVFVVRDDVQAIAGAHEAAGRAHVRAPLRTRRTFQGEGSQAGEPDGHRPYGSATGK